MDDSMVIVGSDDTGIQKCHVVSLSRAEWALDTARRNHPDWKWQIIADERIEREPPKAKNLNATDTIIIRKIEEAGEEGITVPDIVQACGIKKATVHAALKRLRDRHHIRSLTSRPPACYVVVRTAVDAVLVE